MVASSVNSHRQRFAFESAELYVLNVSPIALALKHRPPLLTFLSRFSSWPSAVWYVSLIRIQSVLVCPPFSSAKCFLFSSPPVQIIACTHSFALAFSNFLCHRLRSHCVQAGYISLTFSVLRFFSVGFLFIVPM